MRSRAQTLNRLLKTSKRSFGAEVAPYTAQVPVSPVENKSQLRNATNVVDNKSYYDHHITQAGGESQEYLDMLENVDAR